MSSYKFSAKKICKSPYLERTLLRFQQHNKRHLGASRALLLLVASSTSATLPLPRVLAQPAPAKTDKPTFELAPEKRETFRKFVDLANMENVCKFPLDLKVKDASLEQVVAQIKKVLPPKTLIEVRGALPVRVTFDLHDTTVGGALGPVGSLAGCKLWVFADRVLLSPPGSLSALELADVEAMTGGEWSRNVAAGGSGWWAQGQGKTQLLSAMADVFEQHFAKIATAATGGANNVVNGATTVAGAAGTESISKKAASTVVLFGDLSPDAQAIMQQLVAWTNSEFRQANPRVGVVTLSPNTKITFNNSNPHDVSLDVKNEADSNLAPPSMGWGFTR